MTVLMTRGVEVQDGVHGVDHQFRRVGMVQPPELPPGALPRARLTDKLTVAARHRVTVVSAGPGWGKTMAAASWAASGSAQDPVAWWNLTDADNNPASFWSNLVSAVVASEAVPDHSPLRDHHPPALFVDADVDELWAQLADLPAPVALLLTHWDPVVPLHVLRVNGELTEIRAADLAFTPGEVTKLFASNAVHLRAEQVTRISDGTGGWPASVRVAALGHQSPGCRRRDHPDLLSPPWRHRPPHHRGPPGGLTAGPGLPAADQ